MYLYLVRHLEYENPSKIYAFHLPLYLSVKGRRNADQIASWFVNKRLLGLNIYTSPIVRCVQTAEIIAAQTGSFVASDSRLIESSCSNLQGKEKNITNPWKVEEDDSTREVKDSVRERVISIYHEMVTQNNDCIFISHGDPLTVLYYWLQNRNLPKYLWDPVISQQVVQRGDIVIIKIENRSVSFIDKINVIG